MRTSIIAFEIPVPASSALRQQYLDLGWYELTDPPRLKWSFASGSPRHPGDAPRSQTSHTQRILDPMLLDDLARHLPLADNCVEDVVELRAVLTVQYHKVQHRQRYKGARPIVTWKAVDTALIVESKR